MVRQPIDAAKLEPPGPVRRAAADELLLAEQRPEKFEVIGGEVLLQCVPSDQERTRSRRARGRVACDQLPVLINVASFDPAPAQPQSLDERLGWEPHPKRVIDGTV